MNKRLTGWLASIALVLLTLASPAQAQLTVGSDYVLIDPPQTTDKPDKIEVTEYFSYACPHCNDLNPYISKWAAKLPADVSFKRVPVNFNPFYQLMARLFYTLEAIHELDRLNDAVFEAIHVKGLRLIDDKSILEWVTSQGVDAKKFSDAYSSFGVASKVSRGNQLAQEAKISGVPSITVDGRYLVVGKNVKSHAELLALADKVIDKVRAERSSKKK